MPTFIKNACFVQVCFHTVFSSILEGFVFAFPGARPSLLFTMNSWGASFFAKSEKVSKMTSKSQPKQLQNASRSLQKSVKKRSHQITRNIIEFGFQNYPKMEPKLEEKLLMVAPREHPKPLSKYSFYFLSFLELLYLFLGSLWPPFWHPLAAFGCQFGAFQQPLASFGLPWGCLWPP